MYLPLTNMHFAWLSFNMNFISASVSFISMGSIIPPQESIQKYAAAH